MAQMQLLQMALNKDDIVYTPDWVAQDMVSRFNPSGRILDPCSGNGVFLEHLPSGAEWCEIEKGRDFFAWTKKVDWIVGNPPYKILKEWLLHSFSLAVDIVYIIPMNSPFNSMERLRIILAWGGIKEIRAYGNGSIFGMNYGFACGAFHFKKDYTGKTELSLYSG